MKIIIAGGTGFVGRSVVEQLLSQGHDVFVFSRCSSEVMGRAKSKAIMTPWDGQTLGDWCSVLDGADAVINFSGANISARRWTRRYKHILRESRIRSTRLIVRAIAACANPPRVFINASAVGYYGDSGDRWLDEASDSGSGFLADLCLDWERSAVEAKKDGVRVAVLRMGVVLGLGGVLDKFVPFFRAYVGGPPGSGRQWMSWISTKDLAEIVLFTIRNNGLQGPVNCASPHPLTMNEFCSALGSVLHRPSWSPCPSFAVRLVLGEMADVVLSSQRVMPKKLLAAGFCFQEPLLKDALANIFKGVYK